VTFAVSVSSGWMVSFGTMVVPKECLLVTRSSVSLMADIKMRHPLDLYVRSYGPSLYFARLSHCRELRQPTSQSLIFKDAHLPPSMALLRY
jgi:hypothetical protein